MAFSLYANQIAKTPVYRLSIGDLLPLGSSFRHLKALALSLLGLLVFLVASQSVQALESEQKICFSKDGLTSFQDSQGFAEENCVLWARRNELRVVVDQNARVNLLLETNGLEGEQVEIHSDLLSRVDRSFITQMEAYQIETELREFDGAYYQLPSPSELRFALGFPADTFLAPDDLLELIRVHLQLALSMTPLSAEYLTSLLEIQEVSALSPAVLDPVVVEADTDSVLSSPVEGDFVTKPALP
jgi:hypothetical protein